MTCFINLSSYNLIVKYASNLIAAYFRLYSFLTVVKYKVKFKVKILLFDDHKMLFVLILHLEIDTNQMFLTNQLKRKMIILFIYTNYCRTKW